jgi:hypothetical protein
MWRRPLTTDARNTLNPTVYTCHNMDGLATRKDPLLNLENYQYDGNGNLTQLTGRRGKLTDHSWAAMIRVEGQLALPANWGSFGRGGLADWMEGKNRRSRTERSVTLV